MVSDLSGEGQTGYDDNDNRNVILDLIQRRRRVHLQTLERQLVHSKPRKMSRPTLHRHLRELSGSGEVGKLKDGKQTVYCVPGETLPEKKPPSEADRFLVEEMKKLVSDMIASGEGLGDVEVTLLEQTDDCSPDAPILELTDPHFGQRRDLCKRAERLYFALGSIEYARHYQLPEIPYRNYPWDESVSRELKNGSKGGKVVDQMMKDIWDQERWLSYYIEAIDIITRELSTQEKERPAKAKKAAPRA